MADCLISPVQEIGKEIGKCILTQHVWPFLKSQVDYWWFCDSNINFLRDEILDLERKIDDVTKKIDEAPENAEIRRRAVHEWLSSSKQKLEEARTTLPNDNIPAWKLISRYSLGKNAKEAAEAIANLLNDGMRLTTDVSTMDFDSRKRIEKEIIDSLKQSNVGVIGIYGMGGVGKTTMAKRIGRRVKEENLFEEVAMTTVSQNIDELKIQEEIAENLDLKLVEKTLFARAKELRTRLMDRKRKIIIFDDVWESLEFEKLGIPIESNFERCKVLLTSRSIDTCKPIKNKKVFELKSLKAKEAWILFKEKAGECVEDSALRSAAKFVADECKGLPIAIVTVGLALRDKTNIHIWEDSLSQLRKSNPTDFSEVLRDVYKPLKFSYDSLDNFTAQYLFLLCCLFPEDFDISVDQLTWYSMGLELFDDINNIKEARNRMHTLVEKLKNRFLLIDGKDKLHVKMHDVVRDVAIYIGSKEKNGFLKSLTSIKNSSDVNCNWMSVDISMEVPVLSRFRKLRLLMLQKSKSSSNKLSDISFEGMKELNVLSFERASIGSLPPTLGSLENLQTLCLFYCQVQNISVIGELTSLKILNCHRCTKIMELPAEIGSLSGLRLLELSRCNMLQTIPFGVISSLTRLEELKMSRSFNRWEAEENGKEKRNASLRELECLPNLSCLEIEIDDCTLSAQEICLSQNLVRYYIRIGSIEDYYYIDEIRHYERGYERVMILNLPSGIGAVGKWIKMRVRNTECLCLNGDGCGSNNVNIAESENLRELSVWKCSTLNKLVETKDCKFHNLKSIRIRECDKLRSLFSVSVATTSLLQLEDLEIGFCESMEQVFWNEGTDYNTDGCIEFPKLKGLSLYNLQNLTAFCQGLENIIIKFPNLTQMRIGGLPKLNSLSPLNSKTLVGHDQNTCFHFLCNPKVEMGGLKILRLLRMGGNIRNIWCHQIPNNIFNNLEQLDVIYVNDIRSLMSTSIAKNFVSLKALLIIYCKEMVEVIERDDDDKQVVDINCLFPKLRQLTIVDSNKLRWFWQWNHALELPLLEEVRISNCPVMEAFTLGSINTPNIRKIVVNNKKIDDKKDLNDIMRHIVSQDTSKAEKDGDGDGDKDESQDEYDNENVNKDEDSNEIK